MLRGRCVSVAPFGVLFGLLRELHGSAVVEAHFQRGLAEREFEALKVSLIQAPLIEVDTTQAIDVAGLVAAILEHARRSDE